CEYPLMDDFVTALFNEQRNPNGLLLQVLTSGYEDYEVIIAVEGATDKGFYFDHVREYTRRAKMMFVECKGKRPLLDFKDLVDEYEWSSRPRFLFLCDKDFDEYIGALRDDVWYTPGYSI